MVSLPRMYLSSVGFPNNRNHLPFSDNGRVELEFTKKFRALLWRILPFTAMVTCPVIMQCYPTNQNAAHAPCGVASVCDTPLAPACPPHPRPWEPSLRARSSWIDSLRDSTSSSSHNRSIPTISIQFINLIFICNVKLFLPLQ